MAKTIFRTGSGHAFETESAPGFSAEVPTKHFFWVASVFVAATLTLLAWAFSSPTGSSPDDDFHLASIWCGQGERAGICEEITATSVRVPENVVATPCFAFRPDITGSCQNGLTSELIKTPRANNVDQSYPGGFYWVMSWFVTPNVDFTSYLIRVLNLGIFICFSVIAATQLRTESRIRFVLSIAVTIVPLGMFIIPSTNPSSWALYTPLIAFFLASEFTRSSARAKRVSLALTLVAVSLLASMARADASVFVAFAVALGFATSFRASIKAFRVWLLGGVIALVTFASTTLGRQSGKALGQLVQTEGGQLELVWANLLQVPLLYFGALGTWGLGWLDTQLPAVVYVSTVSVAVGVVFVSMGFIESRQRFIVPVIALVSLIIVPLLILQGAGERVGAFVQPRYVFPLLALAVGAVLSSSSGRFTLSRHQMILISALLVTANLTALHENISRYASHWFGEVTASDPTYWQPLVNPLILLSVGGLSFLLFLVSLSRRLTKGDSRTRDLAPQSLNSLAR